MDGSSPELASRNNSRRTVVVIDAPMLPSPKANTLASAAQTPTASMRPSLSSLSAGSQQGSSAGISSPGSVTTVAPQRSSPITAAAPSKARTVDDAVAFAALVEASESASEVAAILERECRAGHFGCITEAVASYHKQLLGYEHCQIELTRLKVESDALRQSCIEETTRAAELARRLNEMQFRFASGIGGSAGDDDTASSAGGGDVADGMGRRCSDGAADAANNESADDDLADERDDGSDPAATIARLRARLERTRASRQSTRLQLEQQTDRLTKTRESLKKATTETKRTIEMLGETRAALDNERAMRISQTEKMGKEIVELRQKLQSMEARHRTDLANLLDTFQKKEAILAKTNQNLSYEVERLKNIERRFSEAEQECAAAKQELKDQQAAAKETAAELRARYESLRECVRRSFADAAANFDTLPLKLKIGPQRSGPSASSAASSGALLSMAQLGEVDLQRDMNGLTAAIAFMAKVLAEKMSPEVVERVRAERKQLDDIVARRVQVNLLLARADVTQLGDHLLAAKVDELVRTEVDAALRADETRRVVSVESEVVTDAVVPLIRERVGGASRVVASPTAESRQAGVSPLTRSPQTSEIEQSTPKPSDIVHGVDDAPGDLGPPVAITPQSPPLAQSSAVQVASTSSPLSSPLKPQPLTQQQRGGDAPVSTPKVKTAVSVLRSTPLSSPGSRGFADSVLSPASTPQSSVFAGAEVPDRNASDLEVAPAIAAGVEDECEGPSTIPKGVFGPATTMMEEVRRATIPEHPEMHSVMAAERLRNLGELEKTLLFAHDAVEKKGGRKLPRLEDVAVDPASPFGAPRLVAPHGRAGGPAGGKLVSTLAQRKGLPGAHDSKKAQPKLVVKNGTRR